MFLCAHLKMEVFKFILKGEPITDNNAKTPDKLKAEKLIYINKYLINKRLDEVV